MSNKVVNIQEHLPHIEGDAMCLTCDHAWSAIEPIGTVDIKCPSCGTFKGVFRGMTAPETVFECDCGNQVFYVDHDGAMCCRCGIRPGF